MVYLVVNGNSSTLPSIWFNFEIFKIKSGKEMFFARHAKIAALKLLILNRPNYGEITWYSFCL